LAATRSVIVDALDVRRPQAPPLLEQATSSVMLRRCWNWQQAQSSSAAAGTGNKHSQAPPLLELEDVVAALTRRLIHSTENSPTNIKRAGEVPAACAPDPRDCKNVTPLNQILWHTVLLKDVINKNTTVFGIQYLL
jgi:hypothetical protein